MLLELSTFILIRGKATWFLLDYELLWKNSSSIIHVELIKKEAVFTVNTHKSKLFLYCIKLYKQKPWKKYKPTDFRPQLSHLIPHWQYKGIHENVQ